MDKDFFKNKKVVLMGLGLLGRGVNDARWLAKQGAVLTVTDLKTKQELKSSINKLSKYKNIKYVLGCHREEDFSSADMVIKSAGVPLGSRFIKIARQNKVPVYMSTALFVKLAPLGVKIVGITGTRGKSTTAHLLYHFLKSANKKVYLGGNIKGMSTLALLDKIQTGDLVVLELDSWQLQGFGDLKISPHLSIFTTFMPDHLNYYNKDMDRYFKDKANIYRYQKPEDILFLGQQVKSLIKKSSIKIKSKVMTEKRVDSSWKSTLVGKHNITNISLAVMAGQKLGLSVSELKKYLKDFSGVPGRLEYLGRKNNISFYNDTTATTPEAGLAAIESFTTKNIILIAGGSDKELEYQKWSQGVISQVKHLILLPGQATDKMMSFLADNYEYNLVNNIPQAVKLAYDLAKKGDVILLSPSAASFGLFKNEFDRGDKFIRAFNRLK